MEQVKRRELIELYPKERVANRMSLELIRNVVQQAKDSGFYTDAEINEHFYLKK